MCFFISCFISPHRNVFGDYCEIHVRYHTNEKQRCVEQKGSGNSRSKCLQATTHSRAKTMTQTLTKHKDKQT